MTNNMNRRISVSDEFIRFEVDIVSYMKGAGLLAATLDLDIYAYQYCHILT